MTALALAGSGCGDDQPATQDAGDDSSIDATGAALTVEQIMDFTLDHHAQDPFLSSEDAVALGVGPLTDCTWVTDPQETSAFAEAAVALFHCTGGTEDEAGDYPVYVEEYEDEAAAEAGIDDRLLATGETLFVAGTIVVDGPAVDEQEQRFYEALIAECSCGEIVEI